MPSDYQCFYEKDWTEMEAQVPVCGGENQKLVLISFLQIGLIVPPH